MLSLTDKQKEYWRNANCRWNIKAGATRSGKTYLDYYVIPKRIRAVKGKEGLILLLGNTKGTLQRNVIEPLKDIWGSALVGDIRSDNTAMLFGEKVHCLGADKINQVDKLRGSSIKYCYGDEIVTWHKDVFDMLKSRLDKEYSCFDGTCNPEEPNHWFRNFIKDKSLDIFLQEYTIYDNPFLSPKFVKDLEKEYGNTVYFDRYILGKWARAEGLVFEEFVNNKEKYLIAKEDLPKRFIWCEMGYDIGGNKSAYGLTITAQGIDGVVYVLKSKKIQAQGMKTYDVKKACFDFIDTVEKTYGVKVQNCYVDDNYYTLVNDMNDVRYMFGVASKIKNSMPLWDRPLKLLNLMGKGKFKLVEGECDDLCNELEEVVFDDKSDKAIILDDGSTQIDTIDSLWYSMASNWHYI